MTPKVSVIIPTYKRSDMLPRAIDSVINQSYKNIEIIVVDDNNPDSEYRKSTELTVQSYVESNTITYIKHSCNKNGSAARNTGIRNSTGDYIAFLDDDDEFTAEKIEHQVARLESLDESWGACYTSYKKISDSYEQISISNREGNVLLDALARNLFIAAGSNLMVRRSVVLEINGFDENFLRNQDIEFLARILRKHKLTYVNMCGLIVHYEGKTSEAMKYEQYLEIDSKYLESFEPFINNLSPEEKKYVYDIIALQRFKFSLSNKNICDGFKNLRVNKVPLNKVIKYIFYMINRYIRKKSYGFY